MENVIISACLMGFDCKYSGGNNALPEYILCKLKEKYRLIPVCPETAGGLPVPRDPSERLGDKVVSCKGKDVTAEFERGAEVAAKLAARCGCKKAILKAQSPSCGSGIIYDGSFTGGKTGGFGVAAEKLRDMGVEILDEENIE